MKKTGLNLLLIEDVLQHKMLETVQSEWLIKKNYGNEYEGRYYICEIASDIADNMVDMRFNKKCIPYGVCFSHLKSIFKKFY